MPIVARIRGIVRRGAASLRRAFGAGVRSKGRRDPLGPRGEREAARFLRGAGYRIVGSNVRLGPGEIDILAIDPSGRTLVIVEVKTRRVGGGAGGPPNRGSAPRPEASVTEAKRRRLLALARVAASRGRWRGLGVRIDVVGVDWRPDGPPEIRHHVNAVVR